MTLISGKFSTAAEGQVEPQRYVTVSLLSVENSATTTVYRVPNSVAATVLATISPAIALVTSRGPTWTVALVIYHVR